MKNLETEYKDQISLETPDLWSRIEAGVDAYEASKQNTVPFPVRETPAPEANQNVINFRRKKIIGTISRIAVAVACLLIVTLTFNTVRHGFRSESTSAPTTNDSSRYSDAAEAPSPSKSDRDKASEAAEMPDRSESATAPMEESMTATDNMEESDPGIVTAEEPSGMCEALGITSKDAEKLTEFLSLLGLTDVSGFEIEQDSDKMLSFNYGSKSDAGPDYIASFTDNGTGEKYLLYYIKTDDDFEVAAVEKADDPGNFLYTAP